MFGVLYESAYFATTIVTYSILSSAHIHEHSINGLLLGTIWTHGECLQFATLGSESLTIWEVEFSSKCPPTEVKSLLIPKNPGPYMSFFLPNLSWLVFINQDSLFIWDAQHSKLLLDTVVRECGKMSFSSDGHFFACGASGPEIYLWKESPTGYILHKKLIPTGLKRPGFSNTCQPLLSPNGQTIIVPHGFTIQLLQATDSTTSSSVPSQPFPGVYHFILGFSPDRSLVVTARLNDDMATVFDLKSGVTQLIINTGTQIYGLGVTGNTIIIIGHWKIITWNLPMGDHILNNRAGIHDSVQTTEFNNRSLIFPSMGRVLISPCLNYVVAIIHDYESGSFQHFRYFKVLRGYPCFTDVLPQVTPTA